MYGGSGGFIYFIVGLISCLKIFIVPCGNWDNNQRKRYSVRNSSKKLTCKGSFLNWPCSILNWPCSPSGQQGFNHQERSKETDIYMCIHGWIGGAEPIRGIFWLTKLAQTILNRRPPIKRLEFRRLPPEIGVVDHPTGSNNLKRTGCN